MEAASKPPAPPAVPFERTLAPDLTPPPPQLFDDVTFDVWLGEGCRGAVVTGDAGMYAATAAKVDIELAVPDWLPPSKRVPFWAAEGGTVATGP